MSAPQFQNLRLETFSPRVKPRPLWRSTLGSVVFLLVISGVCGWLLHVVRSWMGTGWKAYATPGLAMVPVTAIAVPVVIALMALLVFCAVRKARRERAALGQAYEGEWDPYAGDRPWGGEDNREPQAGSMSHEVDPLAVVVRAFELMPASVSRLDAALILTALAEETRLVRSLVRGARESLSVTDYSEALEAAERRLGELRTRLWQLKAHFDGGLISAADEDDLPKSYGEAARNANAGGVS